MKKIALLKEILGKNKPGYKKHLVCSIYDIEDHNTKLAKVYEDDFPIWHIDKLKGEKIFYSLDNEGWPVITNFNYQKTHLKNTLFNLLLRKGKGSLKKYIYFEESSLKGKYLNFYKTIQERKKLEKIFSI